VVQAVGVVGVCHRSETVLTLEKLIITGLFHIWSKPHFQSTYIPPLVLKHLFQVFGRKVGADVEHDGAQRRETSESALLVSMTSSGFQYTTHLFNRSASPFHDSCKIQLSPKLVAATGHAAYHAKRLDALCDTSGRIYPLLLVCQPCPKRFQLFRVPDDEMLP
jgi:hypothetical protein